MLTPRSVHRGGLHPPLAGAIVKLLDLGLARIEHLTEEQSSSTLAESGAVMGTPDFIAPEQAKHSNNVDIRADLYSLGCTLYYVLTGKVPFPAETLGAKLLKHMMDEPEPVEKLRPEVPPGVAGVIRKLMMKRPEAGHHTWALAHPTAAAAGTAVGWDLRWELPTI